MKALEEYREAKKLTQEQLALILGVEQSQVSRWLSGKQTPRFQTVKHISEKLGISMNKLSRDL